VNRGLAARLSRQLDGKIKVVLRPWLLGPVPATFRFGSSDEERAPKPGEKRDTLRRAFWLRILARQATR
jgi:hypothetical protein